MWSILKTLDIVKSLLSEVAQSSQLNSSKQTLRYRTCDSGKSAHKSEERSPGTKVRGQQTLGAFVSWVKQW